MEEVSPSLGLRVSGILDTSRHFSPNSNYRDNGRATSANVNRSPRPSWPTCHTLSHLPSGRRPRVFAGQADGLLVGKLSLQGELTGPGTRNQIDVCRAHEVRAAGGVGEAPGAGRELFGAFERYGRVSRIGEADGCAAAEGHAQSVAIRRHKFSDAADLTSGHIDGLRRNGVG